MQRKNRSNSASAGSGVSRRAAEQPPVGADGPRERSRDKDSAPTSARVRQRSRPRSAQRQPQTGSARSTAVAVAAPPLPPSKTVSPGSGAAGGGERTLQALQESCLELKRTANNLTEDNAKSRTRLMALERELQKRERLLQEMMQLKKAGQGVGMDLINKLREERNLMPIYRKKAQDMQAQIQVKDSEIAAVKRDPTFTRIIELQVEYATWQHETKRLVSLLQEPSADVSSAAKREMEVHERRNQRLQVELQKAEERRTKVAAELSELEADHEDWTAQHRHIEQELTKQQDTTRELAIGFKRLLQERKRVEELQEEIEKMTLNKQRYEEEIQSARAEGAETTTSGSSSAPAPVILGRRDISREAWLGALSLWSSSPCGPSLAAIRNAAATCVGADSLFAQFVLHDEDADGLVDKHELRKVLTKIGFGPDELSPEEVQQLLDQLPGSAVDGEKRIRWLDLLVILDRLREAPPTASAAPLGALPGSRGLRAACLRARVDSEELRRRLSSALTPTKWRGVFEDLGLVSAEVLEWVRAFEAHGAGGVLLRLPLGEAAPTLQGHEAWLARCVAAVRQHRREFEEAFTKVWREDMLLTEDQFRMVCRDIAGVSLSDDDIDDLALLGGAAGADHIIDGKYVLQMAADGWSLS